MSSGRSFKQQIKALFFFGLLGFAGKPELAANIVPAPTNPNALPDYMPKLPPTLQPYSSTHVAHFKPHEKQSPPIEALDNSDDLLRPYGRRQKRSYYRR